MTAGDLASFLRTRSAILVIGLLIGFATGWYVADTSTRYYTATATVLPAVGGGSTDTGGFAQTVFMQTRVPEYVAFGTTDSFLERVISTYRLPIDRDRLADNLTLSAPADSALIETSVRATDPAAAVTMANATADVLATVIPERENLLPVRVTVVDAAMPPAGPDGIGAGAVIALYGFLGVVGAVLVSLLTTRFRDGVAEPRAPGVLT
ncbi:YveK family protein [Williamsia sp. MIQD14]|uniref:YveK family protein n=1 Tax=Williamsia sp. MIQD14 TaxID=3425703 RepID=UPI003D9FE99B